MQRMCVCPSFGDSALLYIIMLARIVCNGLSYKHTHSRVINTDKERVVSESVHAHFILYSQCERSQVKTGPDEYVHFCVFLVFSQLQPSRGLLVRNVGSHYFHDVVQSKKKFQDPPGIGTQDSVNVRQILEN